MFIFFFFLSVLFLFFVFRVIYDYDNFINNYSYRSLDLLTKLNALKLELKTLERYGESTVSQKEKKIIEEKEKFYLTLDRRMEAQKKREKKMQEKKNIKL